MKEFTFENQGTNTYMVYEVDPTDIVDTMSLGMLTNNKIPGLAPTLFMQIDTTKYIKYNVSAHVSAKQFFTGPVNRKRLIGVFRGIVDAMLAAEDYMIDTNTILLDLDYIFADVSTCETILICLPVENRDAANVDLGTFFKNIVFSTQFDQTENCDYVAKLINYLNSTPVFSLTDFNEVLKDIERNGSVPTSPVQPKVSQPVAPQPVVKQAISQEEKKTVTPQPTVQAASQPVVQPVSQQVAPQPIQPKQVVPQNQGFAIPGQTPVQPVQEQPTQSNDGKKMSMLYLLQHYNKENAAAYKAQKEAQKSGKNQTAPKATMPIPGGTVQPPRPTGKAKVQTPSNQSFAIPGQSSPTPQGFAIPGQPPQPPVSAMKTAQSVTQRPMQPQPVEQPKPVQVQSTPAPTPIQPIHTAPQGQAMNFGETTVLNAATFGETTVLDAGMVQQEVKIQPYLIRAKNNERIELNKPVFRIGKEKSYVDYFISDNTAISRSHANVISRDGEYFVVDTNSTNHTYVNGMMIQSNVETKIADGAKIRLANEEFEFKLI